MAAPTPASLPYIWAVSMWRYPTSKACSTVSCVCSGGTWNTPKPSWGIWRSSLRVTVGTWESVMPGPTTRWRNLFRRRSPYAWIGWSRPVRWGPCVSCEPWPRSP